MHEKKEAGKEVKQEEGNQDLRVTGKVGFGTVGIHYWRIQETRDTLSKGYRK